MKIIIIIILMSFNTYAQVKYISTINSFNMKKESSDSLLMKDNIDLNIPTTFIVNEDDKKITMIENDTTITIFTIELEDYTSRKNIIMYHTSNGDDFYGFGFLTDTPIILLTYPSEDPNIIVAKIFVVTDLKVKNFDTDY